MEVEHSCLNNLRKREKEMLPYFLRQLLEVYKVTQGQHVMIKLILLTMNSFRKYWKNLCYEVWYEK